MIKETAIVKIIVWRIVFVCIEDQVTSLITRGVYVPLFMFRFFSVIRL